jgi:hypothetical protein
MMSIRMNAIVELWNIAIIFVCVFVCSYDLISDDIHRSKVKNQRIFTYLCNGHRGILIFYFGKLQLSDLGHIEYLHTPVNRGR